LYKIMEYAPTSHNRSVCVAPAVAGLASIRLDMSDKRCVYIANLGIYRNFWCVYTRLCAIALDIGWEI
jgi:hypothetical protein